MLEKIRALAIHLVISLAIAMAVALFVYLFWYPPPLDEMLGVGEIFRYIVMVDVVVGPFITFLVFKKNKSVREKVFDFSVIALLQVSALCYGLWTVSLGRPVLISFEYDRLRVVLRSEIDDDKLAMALEDFRKIPWKGYRLVSLRPLNANEQMDFTYAAFAGVPVSAQPQLWRQYSESKNLILSQAKSVTALTRDAVASSYLDKFLSNTGYISKNILFLPVVAKNNIFWTAFIDASSAEIIGFIPVDSFDIQ